MRYSLMIRGRKVAQQYSRFFDHALYIRGYQFASADRFFGGFVATTCVFGRVVP